MIKGRPSVINVLAWGGLLGLWACFFTLIAALERGGLWWLYFVGTAVLAGLAWVGAVALDRRSSASSVARNFVCSANVWRGVALASLILSISFVTLVGNRPWSPLQPCTRDDLAALYSGDKCLVRTISNRSVPWEQGGGSVRLRVPGSITDQDVQEAYVDDYGWMDRPTTPIVLLVISAAAAMLWIRLRRPSPD